MAPTSTYKGSTLWIGCRISSLKRDSIHVRIERVNKLSNPEERESMACLKQIATFLFLGFLLDFSRARYNDKRRYNYNWKQPHTTFLYKKTTSSGYKDFLVQHGHIRTSITCNTCVIISEEKMFKLPHQISISELTAFGTDQNIDRTQESLILNSWMESERVTFGRSKRQIKSKKRTSRYRLPYFPLYPIDLPGNCSSITKLHLFKGSNSC